MVEHLSSNIKFGLILSVSGVSFVIGAMVSPIFINCDHMRVLDMDDSQFPA